MRLRLQRLREDREGGFTLIELLIVIVIIGILAAIVVFSVSGINNNAQKNACVSNATEAQTAVEAYYAQSNPHGYPPDLATLQPSWLKTDPTAGLASDQSIKYNSTTGTVTGSC